MADTMSPTKMLEIVQAYSTRVISPEDILRRVGGLEHYLTWQLPANMNAMVVTLMSLFAAEPVGKWDISYPADWWEAVKERFAPAWFVQRYPVRRKHFHLDVKAIWQNFRPDDWANKKYGPMLPYVLQQEYETGDPGDEC